MKKAILLPFLTFLLFTSYNTTSQESNYLKDKDSVQVFDILEVNGKFRKNLRFLDFLRKDRRFSNRQLARLAKIQINTNKSSFTNDNSRGPSGSIPFLYLDGELIVGDGINRLYLVDQLYLKDIRTIATKRKGFDKLVYVTTMKSKKKS